MRVYVPATPAALAALAASGVLPVAGPAYAVTAALRAWATSDGPADDEELELAAQSEAARHSLRLLASPPAVDRAAAPVRTVVAADLPDGDVTVDDIGPEAGPGQVRIDAHAVALARIAAILVDDPAAAPLVRDAVGSVGAADAGDDAAERVVSRLDDHDLLWYDPAELTGLLP